MADDGGTESEPVCYTSYPGERARLIGGIAITDWVPVDDSTILARLDPAARMHVVQADLRSLGIDDYGTYHPRGHGGGTAVAALELFYNGKPMTISR